MQKNDMNEIDRLLREKLENFGSEPSPELWKNIAEKIQDKPDKDKPVFGWFKIILGIALLISVSASSVYLFMESGSGQLALADRHNGSLKNQKQNSVNSLEQINDSGKQYNNTVRQQQNSRVNVNTDHIYAADETTIGKEDRINNLSATGEKLPGNDLRVNSGKPNKESGLVLTNRTKKTSLDNQSGLKASKNQNARQSADLNKKNSRKPSIARKQVKNADSTAGNTNKAIVNIQGKRVNADPGDALVKTNTTGVQNMNSKSNPGFTPDSSSDLTSGLNGSDSIRRDSGNHPVNNNNTAGTSLSAISPDSGISAGDNLPKDSSGYSLAGTTAKDSSTVLSKDSSGLKNDSSEVKKTKADPSHRLALNFVVSPLCMMNSNSAEYHNRLNYLGTLGIEYRISPKFSLSAGLGLLAVRNRLESYFRHVTYDSIQDSLQGNYKLVIKSIEERTAKANNHYSYLSIPLLLKYEGSGEKFWLSISLGLNPSFVLSAKESYAREGRAVESDRKSFNTFTMSTMTNLALNYRISQKIILFAGPELRLFLNDIHKNRDPGISRPMLLGIGTGIKIIL